MSDSTQQLSDHSYKPIKCNLLIIDSFYNNPMETRKYILTQEFNVTGNYPGARTISYANELLKNTIESYIINFAGKITDWPTEKSSYNGAFNILLQEIEHGFIMIDGIIGLECFI